MKNKALSVNNVRPSDTREIRSKRRTNGQENTKKEIGNIPRIPYPLRKDPLHYLEELIKRVQI